jgi:hypothetical protein
VRIALCELRRVRHVLQSPSPARNGGRMEAFVLVEKGGLVGLASIPRLRLAFSLRCLIHNFDLSTSSFESMNKTVLHGSAV